jgi:hypothetical protein
MLTGQVREHVVKLIRRRSNVASQSWPERRPQKTHVNGHTPAASMHVRDKVTSGIVSDLADDWEKHGSKAVESFRETDVAAYVRICVSLRAGIASRRSPFGPLARRPSADARCVCPSTGVAPSMINSAHCPKRRGYAKTSKHGEVRSPEQQRGDALPAAPSHSVRVSHALTTPRCPL